LSPVATRRYAMGMTMVPSLNPRIVEALYIEALVLADAARSRFDELRESAGVGEVVSDTDGIELTCEALRTTTRVMHCLAWLLNHRPPAQRPGGARSRKRAAVCANPAARTGMAQRNPAGARGHRTAARPAGPCGAQAGVICRHDLKKLRRATGSPILGR